MEKKVVEDKKKRDSMEHLNNDVNNKKERLEKEKSKRNEKSKSRSVSPQPRRFSGSLSRTPSPFIKANEFPPKSSAIKSNNKIASNLEEKKKKTDSGKNKKNAAKRRSESSESHSSSSESEAKDSRKKASVKKR